MAVNCAISLSIFCKSGRREIRIRKKTGADVFTYFETCCSHGPDIILILRFENLYNIHGQRGIASFFYVHTPLYPDQP